jgi:CheY-like chemotaxis protein
MEALGTLAGGVAHDFNNILATIMGNADLVRQDVGPGHVALESLEEIAKASRRARDLVRQILAFGRRQAIERKVVSLAPVVEEAARLLRATLPTGIHLNVVCEADAPMVLADAIQVEQLILNLCTNSWHALRGQERDAAIGIRLSAGMRGDLRFAVLKVRDNGHGMDETTRSRMFEPFFTTKPVGEGTGLGLSVVHGIVQEHGAEVEVISAPGEGTSIRIHFPAAQMPEQLAAAHAPPVASARGQGKHVLYVDDDESIVFLMTRLLERKGFRVSGYTNPYEALAAARADPGQFDLAVTDYNMPGLSGLDVARTLREIRPELPVILASGYITEDLQQKAPAAGVRELIYKPDTADDLCEAVARFVSASWQTKGIG